MPRYRRIIADNKEFEQKAQKLRVALIGRGYKDKDILPHINMASTFTQSQLLSSHSTTNTSRTLPFVIPYNPDLTPLPHILKRHWQYITGNIYLFYHRYGQINRLWHIKDTKTSKNTLYAPNSPTHPAASNTPHHKPQNHSESQHHII